MGQSAYAGMGLKKVDSELQPLVYQAIIKTVIVKMS